MAEFMKFNAIVATTVRQCAGNMDHGTAAAFLVAQQKFIQDKVAEARRSGASGGPKVPVSGGQRGNADAKAAATGGMARLQAMLSKK